MYPHVQICLVHLCCWYFDMFSYPWEDGEVVFRRPKMSVLLVMEWDCGKCQE